MLEFLTNFILGLTAVWDDLELVLDLLKAGLVGQ